MKWLPVLVRRLVSVYDWSTPFEVVGWRREFCPLRGRIWLGSSWNSRSVWFQYGLKSWSLDV